jgi:hypothetical protein
VNIVIGLGRALASCFTKVWIQSPALPSSTPPPKKSYLEVFLFIPEDETRGCKKVKEIWY